MTEHELKFAYRHTVSRSAEPMRVEKCACGGFISAPPLDAERIRIAVEGHQQTSIHRAWWAWRDAN